MGDFNTDRYEASFMQDFAFEPPHSNPEGLYNLMYTLPNDAGTHNYGGRWSCLDQIFYRPPQEAKNGDLPKVRIFKPEFLLEKDKNNLTVRPLRTYRGQLYLGGFSDHLPIYFDLH